MVAQDDESCKENRLTDGESFTKEEVEMSMWDRDRIDFVVYMSRMHEWYSQIPEKMYLSAP